MKIFLLLFISIYYNYYSAKAQIRINHLKTISADRPDSISTQSKVLHPHLSTVRKPFYLGGRLGLNYANLNFNRGYPRPVTPIETQWKTGLVVGLTIQLPVCKQFTLQQEYLFTQLRSEIKGTGPQYTLNYLTLPVLAKYTIFSKVAVVAGMQFDLLISAKEYALGQTNTITHETEERGFNALVGLEVQFGKHVRSSARFLRGLNHITLGKNSAAGQEIKTEVAQLTLDLIL